MRDKKLKLEDAKGLHTRWIGGRGHPRRGTRIGGERFESERGECASVKR
jgi:hypothetical protein